MLSAVAIAVDNSVPTDANTTFAPGSQIAVQLPLPIPAYDYRVAEGAPLHAGEIVEVPLGRRFEVGVVWGPGTGEIALEKLREVVNRRDLPPLPEPLRKFIEWVAGYTLQ